MGRTHDVTISAFDLDRLESQLSAAEEEIEELKTQLGDAKTTADLWMAHAKMADESAADLKAELADTRRYWKEAEAGMEFRRDLWQAVTDQLSAERALADRLGNALEKIPWTFAGREEQASEEWNAVAAWKEARSE